MVTLGRLITALAVVFLLSAGGIWRIVGGMLFVVASVSDLVDGYLARSRGEVTELGKLADPVADKVLLLSGILPLVECRDIPAWLGMLILAREFAVMGLRCVAARRGVVVPADAMGKVKTFLYTVGISLMVFGLKVEGLYVLYMGFVVSLLSAVNYFVKNAHILKEV